MKGSIFFLLLPALFDALFVAADGRPGLQLSNTGSAKVVANRYIVEIDSTKVMKRDVHALDAVFQEAKTRSLPVEIGREYRVDGIFTGASVILESAHDVASLASVPGVKAIRPVKSFAAPRLPKRHVVTGRDDPAIPPDLSTTHVLGGVDKIHAEGNVGEGIKIGIIDTGIDYNHPALGSNGFGPGKKIFAGHDFSGDLFNSNDDDPKVVPDNDPMDCAGHGTHVAGIISMDPGNEYNVSGVAFGATIAAYKIFGCHGATNEEVIVAALLQAHRDGCDVLNLSLGEDYGWATSSGAIVADRIALSGKIVAIAAGNAGDSGSWYASSPAAAEHVLAVGSVDNSFKPLQNATVHGDDHAPIPYFSGAPLNITGTLLIYAVSKDITVPADACAPLPDSTPDLSPYLVVIRSGTCSSDKKVANIAAKGAKAALIYDNGDGFFPISTPNFTSTSIQATDGEYLVQAFAAGKNISISFPHTGASFLQTDPNGGLMSSFSSYGPTFDFKFKPALSAPGGNIMATIPLKEGGWGVLSGTSMATPYMAGVSALYLAAKGKSDLVAKTARDVFQVTSTKIAASQNDLDSYDTVSKAGAGLINAYKAIHAPTTIVPGQLVLNDTANFQRLQKILIQNHSDQTKSFAITHIPALTALTMEEDGYLPSLGPVPLVHSPARVSVSEPTIQLLPGQARTVTLQFTPPIGVDKNRYPLYSGFIEITSGSESYHVSYIGLAASLKDHPIFDTTTKIMPIASPAVLDAADNLQNDTTTYTFANGDFPTILYRLLMGTSKRVVDLVDANTTLKPTIEKSMAGSMPGNSWHAHNRGTYSKVNIIGSLYIANASGRNDETFTRHHSNNTAYNTLLLKKPKFANGTNIADGQYRILLRALKITGDAFNEDDYESWLSPIIGIKTQ